MSGNKKPVIYLDSCIWISMITGEQRQNASESAAVAGLVSSLDKKQIIVVSSSLLNTEVLETTMTEQQNTVFQGVMKRKSVVQMKEIITPITVLAGEIRNHYKSLKDKTKSNMHVPKTPDAIHLATAIYFECEIFFTFDEGLLGLSNPIAEKYVLNISKPYIDQLGLNLEEKK